jgi:hypothetical protein
VIGKKLAWFIFPLFLFFCAKIMSHKECDVQYMTMQAWRLSWCFFLAKYRGSMLSTVSLSTIRCIVRFKNVVQLFWNFDWIQSFLNRLFGILTEPRRALQPKGTIKFNWEKSLGTLTHCLYRFLDRKKTSRF